VTSPEEFLHTCQDVVALSAIAVAVLWGAKIVRPASDLDRLCVPGSILALLATLAAEAVAFSQARSLVPWALVLVGPQFVLTLITLEFGSRLWTLVPAILAPGVLILLGGLSATPLGFPPDWTLLGATGAWVGTGFLLAAAAAVPIQAIFGSPRTVTSRRTLRTLGASWGGLAEVAFRMVAWSLPFLTVTGVVAATHPALVSLSPGRWIPVPAFIVAALVYLFVTRRVGDDPGHHPAGLVLLAAAAGAWLLAWG
jgi:hypothetical protein